MASLSVNRPDVACSFQHARPRSRHSVRCRACATACECDPGCVTIEHSHQPTSCAMRVGPHESRRLRRSDAVVAEGRAVLVAEPHRRARDAAPNGPRRADVMRPRRRSLSLRRGRARWTCRCAERSANTAGCVAPAATFWRGSRRCGRSPTPPARALTGNAAEHAVRKSMLWRRGCRGSQSEPVLRFAERVLMVTEQPRRHGDNVFDYLVAAARAAVLGQPPPTLVALQIHHVVVASNQPGRPDRELRLADHLEVADRGGSRGQCTRTQRRAAASDQAHALADPQARGGHSAHIGTSTPQALGRVPRR